MTKNYRIPLMLFSITALLAAMWAGLIRLGWRWPALQPTLPLGHGPLMISGFLGTLLILERAVAMGKRWPYVGSALSGIGGLMIAFGMYESLGPLLVTFGSFWMVIIFIVVLRKHWASYTLVMGLGALAWLIGNLFWLFSWPVHRFVLWWAGFLILTIVGERLELGRMLQLSRGSKIAFNVGVSIFIVGLVVMMPIYDLGVSIVGLGMLLLALWLLRYDIARRTVRQTGITRYIAVCLLSGYVWMIVSGVIALMFSDVIAGPIYDAMLHAIFLGFVFSMIFGHAPIIFPAVLEFPVDYRATLYWPLILLHTSLLLRIVGELAGSSGARLWGGLINVISLLIFLGMIAPIRQLFKKKKLV
ncbi:MAG: hypothetical protein IMY76_07345 [Chloroflexi bacterium]|nr:hypothetical protein [Chloroflexota bacterium]